MNPKKTHKYIQKCKTCDIDISSKPSHITNDMDMYIYYKKLYIMNKHGGSPTSTSNLIIDIINGKMTTLPLTCSMSLL